MPVFSFPSVEEVLEQALSETLGTSGSQPTALQDTALIREIDVINRTFVSKGQTLHPSKGWEWMQVPDDLFNTKSSTTLNGAVATTDTSITLTDSSDFDSAGRFVVENSNNVLDFIDYTGNAANVLSGVTDIGLDHATGSHAEKLYALPSNHGKTKELIVDGVYYDYVRTQKFPIGIEFTIIGDYILMPKNIGNKDVQHVYEKSPTDLSTGVIVTDKAKSMDIPFVYYRYAVEKLKSYIFRLRNMEEKVGLSEQLAQEVLEHALAANATPSSSENEGLQSNY